MLSWDDFRYVKSIADAGSLAGAAGTLGVNHSTVFRRLAQIEQALGSRLFERGRAGYALTPCGEEMVQLAERVSEEILVFERKVTGHDLRPSGELRVTCSDTVLLHLLSDVLAGFRAAYPEIVLDVVVSNSILNLSKRDADVAVRVTFQAPDPSSGRRLAHVAWAVFGQRIHSSKPFDPQHDVVRHHWVGFSDPVTVPRVGRWLKERGGESRIVYKVNTMLGQAEAAARGIGLALLPCFIGDTIPGLARLTEPLAGLEGELWLVSHPDLRNTARVRAFLDYCGAEMDKRRAALECKA